jgi:hypothetical protein
MSRPATASIPALLALVCALLAASNSASGAEARTPTWKVYAVRYATIAKFPVHELVAGADTTRTLDIAMMF